MAAVAAAVAELPPNYKYRQSPLYTRIAAAVAHNISITVVTIYPAKW